jgi:hypothetical protein
MGKNERKAFKRKKGTQVVDFKRPKVKVGKKLKPANATDTSFTARSVRMPGQHSIQEKGDAVTKRNLNMKDLMTQLEHYSAKVRKDALWGIKELTSVHKNVVLGGETLGRLLRRLIELVVDNDKEVRKALLALFHHLFQHVDDSVGSSIINVYIAYIGSAMSNLESDIRLDAIDFASILLTWNPVILKKYEGTLLPNYIALLKSSLSIRPASSKDGFAVGNGDTAILKQGGGTMILSKTMANDAYHKKKSKKKKESKHLKRISKVIDGINMLITYKLENSNSSDIKGTRLHNTDSVWNAYTNNNALPPLYSLKNRVDHNESQQQTSIQESYRSRSLENGNNAFSLGSSLKFTDQGRKNNNKNNIESSSSEIQLLRSLLIAWNHFISFLDIKNSNVNNSKRNFVQDDVSIAINTMKRVVDVFYALIERIEVSVIGEKNDSNMPQKTDNQYYGLFSHLRNTLLSTFPIKKEGSIGNLPFVEIAGLNASLCRTLVRLGQIFGGGNIDRNAAYSDGDEVRGEKKWSLCITDYLREVYEREITRHGKCDNNNNNNNNNMSKFGMIALIEVLPNILYEVESRSFCKTIESFTDYFNIINPKDPVLLGACLKVILQILKRISTKNNHEIDHGVDGKKVVMVWTSMIPKLVWRLGKCGDENNVYMCFQILYRVLHISEVGMFANFDSQLFGKQLGMLVMFFYTKASVNKKGNKNNILTSAVNNSTSSTKKEIYGPFFEMSEKVKIMALNVFFYCPNINQFMLRALAVCINHPAVSQKIRIQILELIFHRKEDLGPALYLSCMISALLDPTDASKQCPITTVTVPIHNNIETSNYDQSTLLFHHRINILHDICYILENYVSDTVLLKAFTAQLVVQIGNINADINNIQVPLLKIYSIFTGLKACLKTLTHSNQTNTYEINSGDRRHILNCIYKFMGVTQHDEDIKYKCTALLVTLLDHDTMLRIDFFNESIAHVINTIKDKDNCISNIRCESQLMYIHDMWNSSVNFQSKWIRYLKSNQEAATNIKNLLMAILNQPDKNSGIIKLVLTLKVEMFE